MVTQTFPVFLGSYRHLAHLGTVSKFAHTDGVLSWVASTEIEDGSCEASHIMTKNGRCCVKENSPNLLPE